MVMVDYIFMSNIVINQFRVAIHSAITVFQIEVYLK